MKRVKRFLEYFMINRCIIYLRTERGVDENREDL